MSKTFVHDCRCTIVFKLHLNLLIHSTETLSFSSIQHCTYQLQRKYSRRQITVLNEMSYSAMLNVKRCNVKHNSESLFCYFASAVNSNLSTKCNGKNLYATCSYFFFLCTPFVNHCLIYSDWAFEITLHSSLIRWDSPCADSSNRD